MKLKQLITDDDAVSPVIGVVLMVAITVILAAVIGTFVLGLGDQVQQTAPSASITFDQSAGNDDNIKISHDGGESLEKGNIDIVYEDGKLTDNPGVDDWVSSVEDDGEITAGETVTIQADGTDFSSGDIVKVVWTASDGSTSSTIAEYEVQ